MTSGDRGPPAAINEFNREGAKGAQRSLASLGRNQSEQLEKKRCPIMMLVLSQAN
jgi:hypothetical protein